MGARRGIPCVATNDVHFVHREGHRLHHVLRAIDRNTTLDRVPPGDLAEPARAVRLRRGDGGALPARARGAGERGAPRRGVRGRLADGADRLSLVSARPRATRSRSCARAARRGFSTATAATPRRTCARASTRELAIIRDKGYADYFLIVEAITSRTPRTCGRGSGAASIVAYLLGITHVDPVRHNLFFERFLSPERKDPPDIDVDFAWDERDAIQLAVLEENGAPVRAAMVANHVGFRARGAIHEIAKVYGLPEAEIMNVTRRLAQFAWLEDPVERLDGRPRFKDVDFEPPWPEILAQAVALEGHPRHLSVHSGGVVLVPDALADHVPVEIAPKGVPIVQWEKDQVEDYGLVKMDLLGNRSLAVIRDAVAAVERNTGLAIDERTWNPIDDPDTQRLMQEGNTIGVFYVESPSMRQLQRKARVGDFDHLVIHSSMIRPAANRFIREYVRRLHGGAYEPLHPALTHTLDETYGIMCYQEDVTKVSMELAGLTLAQAEGLRKALSQKRPVKPLRAYQAEFYAGAGARGVTRDVIDKVWEMILSFAGYSFCKPHSASYAMVSFRSGWLRAHYPAEFMAAVISNQGGYYSTFAYVSEAKRMGLAGPASGRERERPRVHGEGTRDPRGADAAQGTPRGATEALLAERGAGGSVSLVRRTCARACRFARATRSCSSRRARSTRSPRGGHGRSFSGSSISTAGDEPPAPARARDARPRPLRPPAVAAPRARGYDRATMLRHEVETLGFLLSAHPLEPYERAMRGRGVIAARDLDRHAGRRVRVLGWHVSSKLVQTKDLEPMEFLAFEDTTAIYDVTLFPDAYRRFCHLLTNTRPFLLTGLVEEDFGVCTLTVDHVERL